MIRVRHHHDAQRGPCLSPWQTDAVVTASPVPLPGMLAVHWAGDARLPGGRDSLTVISGFGPGEQALRIGHFR